MEKPIIDIDKIDYLAELSNFNFTDKEKEIMQKEVSGIIGMLERCQDVQLTENIAPQNIGLSSLREDDVAKSLKKDVAIGQAISTSSDYIVIPKVVD